MNKKRTYTLVALLIAIVALGIGYAAVTSLLDITGNATALESDGVQLEFTGTPTNNGTQPGNSASINSGNKTAVCTVVLKTAGESATCSYTVTNNTTDTSLSATNLAATVYEESTYDTAWTNSSSDYFTITTNVGQTTLANAASTTVTVTVTLKKENVTGSPKTENFYVAVTGTTSQS